MLEVKTANGWGPMFRHSHAEVVFRKRPTETCVCLDICHQRVQMMSKGSPIEKGTQSTTRGWLLCTPPAMAAAWIHCCILEEFTSVNGQKPLPNGWLNPVFIGFHSCQLVVLSIRSTKVLKTVLKEEEQAVSRNAPCSNGQYLPALSPDAQVREHGPKHIRDELPYSQRQTGYIPHIFSGSFQFHSFQGSFFSGIH